MRCFWGRGSRGLGPSWDPQGWGCSGRGSRAAAPKGTPGQEPGTAQGPPQQTLAKTRLPGRESQVLRLHPCSEHRLFIALCTQSKLHEIQAPEASLTPRGAAAPAKLGLRVAQTQPSPAPVPLTGTSNTSVGSSPTRLLFQGTAGFPPCPRASESCRIKSKTQVRYRILCPEIHKARGGNKSILHLPRSGRHRKQQQLQPGQAAALRMKPPPAPQLLPFQPFIQSRGHSRKERTPPNNTK